jgi:hypothetical protein
MLASFKLALFVCRQRQIEMRANPFTQVAARIERENV